MTANPEKFPQEVIDNVRNYHMREGNLRDELEVILYLQKELFWTKSSIMRLSSTADVNGPMR